VVKSELAGILRQIRRAAAAGLRDQELLEHYVAGRDQAAFELLVCRHGRTAFGVCRRVLGDVQDAEDAFQAAILVFARKAAGIRSGTSLACWLHKVAYRVALTLQAERARRRARERWLIGPEKIVSPPAAICSLERAELRQILDEEVNRLPERFRAPIVLCLLEGRTIQEAAHELGLPRGTVASRLARARRLLRKRLAGRGLALAAALTAIKESAAAYKPLVLAAAIIPQATRVAVVGVSPAVATLTRKVLQTMLLRTLWFKGSVVALLFGLTLAGGTLLWQLRADAGGPVEHEPIEGITAVQTPDQPAKNSQPAANAGPPRVRVIRPVERKAAPTLDFAARLDANQTVEVLPPVSGRLEKVFFKVGADVKKGDPLFQIDAEKYQLDLLKAEASVAVLEVKKKQSQAELKRGQELQKAKAIDQSEFDKLAAQAAVDEAALNAGRVDVEQAKRRVGSTLVTAPISGRAGRPAVDLGSQIYGDGSRPTVLTKITTLDPIRVSFDMDERSFLYYQRLMREREVQVPGSRLRVALAQDKGFGMEGMLEGFGDQIDPQTGTIRVHASVPNPDKTLLPGMFARVRMTFGMPRTVFEVPTNAFVVDKGIHYLFVVTGQNRLERRPIKLDSFGEEQLVTEGLRFDEWVVAKEGVKNLRAGDLVQPEPVTASGMPASKE
jgi:multidrug efflux system membrane fusion protein